MVAGPAERVLLQGADTAIAAPVNTAGDKERHPDIGKFPVREGRTVMAERTAPLTHEQFQTTLCRFRITGHRRCIAAGQRVPEIIETGSFCHLCFLPGGQRLADIRQQPVGSHLFRQNTETAVITIPQIRIFPHGCSNAFRRVVNLGCVQNGPDTGRPEAVTRPVPSEPATTGQIQGSWRVPGNLLPSGGRGQTVAEGKVRAMAVTAGHRPVGGQTGITEQGFTEPDGPVIAGNPVG